MRNDVILSGWSLSADGGEWADDFLESVFFTGNGRMGVRGYLPFEPAIRPVQRGMFVAGIFGEIKSGITDFVNLPTPVWEEIYIDGQQASLASKIHRNLDLSRSVYTVRCTLRAGEKLLDVEHLRFFSYGNTALMFQRTVCRPRQNMSICLKSGILTASVNCPVPDDQTKSNSDTISLARLRRTEQTQQGFMCRFDILGTGLKVSEDVCFNSQMSREPAIVSDCSVTCRFTAELQAGQTASLDKLTCVRTSRDIDRCISDAPGVWSFDEEREKLAQWWQERWSTAELSVAGSDSREKTALRYNIYQLIVNCSAGDPSVSIGARGITHTRYKGCYFWDTDIFMLPFFDTVDKAAARNLCEYRVRTLPAAKEHSRRMNTLGARYPWMAALDGTEQCETWDIGCSEVHISADIPYALARYCTASGDREFYLDHAAEVFIETARFWKSRYTFSTDGDRCDLLFCKGPDEYCGVINNNLYTNVMVQYNLELACAAAADLMVERPELYDRLGVSEAEVASWQRMHDMIPWPHDPNTGRLSSDDNFYRLESVDISSIKSGLGASYHRICFDALQRYKVVKQADVLLLMTRLPERFTAQEKLAAWSDFEPICLHDSTLSFASHALFAVMNGLNEAAKEYYQKALFLDLCDLMDNTGKEGLHLANMGETWQTAYEMRVAQARES